MAEDKPSIPSIPSIRSASARCASAVVAELAALVARNGERVESATVRELANRLDGIRYALNVLADEKLIDATDPDEWREALRVLRLVEQTAACSQAVGFSSGINYVRTAVARMLEQAS